MALNPASLPFMPANRTDINLDAGQNGHGNGSASPAPRLPMPGAFNTSSRASPSIPDPRAQSGFDAASASAVSQGTAPVFRSSFDDRAYYAPVRPYENIAPDQREPFITVDSPPSSGASPTFHTAEGDRQHSVVDPGLFKDKSSPIPPDLNEEVPVRPASGPFNTARQQSLGTVYNMQRHPSLSSFSLSRMTPDPLSNSNPFPTSNHTGNVSTDPVLASSPVSSISVPSAASGLPPHADKGFDAQAKTSPFLHDILDRVIRTEYAQRDLSREVGALMSKVNYLVERLELSLPHRGSSSPLVDSPLASAPSNSHREEGNISKRLDALTTSVQQMLLVQQQQAHQFSPLNTGLPPSVNASQALFNEYLATVPPAAPMLSHGPNRGGQRAPAPPTRSFSTSGLDLPPLRADPHLGQPSNFLAQKRRSVAGNLTRRDSTMTVDSDWGGNSPRDSASSITKWEHLPLSADLLRSIAKYGVGPPNKIQQRALPFLLNGADIIAQAPPTQERIAAYVIPAVHMALAAINSKSPGRGPVVLVISTTVDQATQAQRMIRDLGGPIGIRSALGVGTGGDVQQEIRLLHQNMPHILCGTPQKLNALFTAPGGLAGNEIRFLVLDEVDQLIARNLHDFVFSIVRLLPAPRTNLNASSPGTNSNAFSPFETPTSANNNSNPQNNGPAAGGNRKFPPLVHVQNPNDPPNNQSGYIRRQTALFSNTVPQDVLNLASAIQLKDAVRVLVRRDGNVSSSENQQGGTRGLRQFYLYLAFTAAGAAGRLSNAGLPPSLGSVSGGRNLALAETEQAKEWKLDALADLFIDLEQGHAIVHVNSLSTLDSVVYKLASRGLDAIPLHTEMNPGTKLAALNKFRGGATGHPRQPSVTRVLVVFDVQVKSPDVFQVPLVINYDLPKAVEDYAHRVAPAISSNYSRAGVVINFVTATGGDVEMLRSIECFYKIKCPEVPISLREVL